MSMQTPQHKGVRFSIMIAAECVCFAAFLAVLPVLLHPRFDILDCALFCDIAELTRWSEPATFLFPQFLDNRARPGFFAMLLPAYVSMHPGVHYWFQTLALLAVPMLGLFLLLHRIMRRVWLPVAGVLAVLCVQPFAENYYTLFKAEPWTLAGCILMSLLLWHALFGDGSPRRLLSFLAAFIVYAIKETGIAYMGAYVAALVLLGWASGLPWRTVLRRTAWLSAANLAGCALFIVFFMRLDSHYSADGATGYAVGLGSMWPSFVRMFSYFVDTMPHALLLLPLVALGFDASTLGQDDGQERRQVRVEAAWTAYFVVLAAGMAAVLLPWKTFVPRYMLVSAAALATAAVLGIGLAWRLRRTLAPCLWRHACTGIGIVLPVILALHMVYALMVGIWSEGRFRQNFDRAYDDMYTYVARHTPTNGVAYFIMNPEVPETLLNTVTGMRLFYHRPDIRCEFPVKAEDMIEPGLVAVSCIADFHFNYPRTPTHYSMSFEFPKLFPPNALPPIRAAFVQPTPLWFAFPEYEREQYESVWGIPAFWRLQKERHAFGWNVCWFKGDPTRQRVVPVKRIKRAAGTGTNLLVNGDFSAGIAGWKPWGDASLRSNATQPMSISNAPGLAYGVVMHNRKGSQTGLRQDVAVVPGAMYRLSAVVRSPRDRFGASRLFGARIACNLDGQPEAHAVWTLNEYSAWTEQDVVFTNVAARTAAVIVHMGYGSAEANGEFADVRFERIR